MTPRPTWQPGVPPQQPFCRWLQTLPDADSLLFPQSGPCRLPFWDWVGIFLSAWLALARQVFFFSFWPTPDCGWVWDSPPFPNYCSLVQARRLEVGLSVCTRGSAKAGCDPSPPPQLPLGTRGWQGSPWPQSLVWLRCSPTRVDLWVCCLRPLGVLNERGPVALQGVWLLSIQSVAALYYYLLSLTTAHLLLCIFFFNKVAPFHSYVTCLVHLLYSAQAIEVTKQQVKWRVTTSFIFTTGGGLQYCKYRTCRHDLPDLNMIVMLDKCHETATFTCNTNEQG